MRRTRAAFEVAIVFALIVIVAHAQGDAHERTFPQSKATIEKTLKAMQGNMAGRLPVLDGFAKPGEHPLERYQRGYFQAAMEVTAASSGGSVVRVTARVTAWYADPSGGQSGYQLLTSNGRIEADLLDQLSEQLASAAPATEPATTQPTKTAVAPVPEKTASEATISAPSPQFPTTSGSLSSTLSHGMVTSQPANQPTAQKSAAEKAQSAMQAEADNLEKILKEMAHPNNLVAVKKSGTPVVPTPSLTAKAEFLAGMHDEFELLDFNEDWVHVRISGLSRGWIWRNSVEMPEGIPDTQQRSTTAAGDLFRVSREEMAQFPGDWEPLRNRNVKIISVQKTAEAHDAGPKERLEFAKFLLENNFVQAQAKPQNIQGIVLVFDSADGGMIAATLSTLQQWKSGMLTDAALWHNCFFDPPETFNSAASSGSR